MAIKQRLLAPGHEIIFDGDRVTAPPSEWFSADYWQQQGKVIGQAKGRGTTVFVQRDQEVWVLRHYRRGGLVGKALTDQFAYTGMSRSRALQEFRLLMYMRDLGLPVPAPIAAQVIRSGLIYRADLITALIPDSDDLHRVLCLRALSAQEWHSVGEVVARLHQAQIYHHDLNVRNIMLDARGEFWIIDFDRCSKRTGEGWKTQNLQRLLRSLRKEQQRNNPFHWQDSDWQHFMHGYQSYLASR